MLSFRYVRMGRATRISVQKEVASALAEAAMGNQRDTLLVA